MGFALLGYQGTPGVNAASTDLTALSDPDFSQRNSHYIFTEPYKLFAAMHLETSAIGASISAPTFNAIGQFNIWPVNRAITQQSPPRIDLRRDAMPFLPLNEEIAFQVSNNLGSSTEQAYGFLWLVSQDWNQNIPQGRMPIMVRATATFNPGSVVWSGPQAITFSQALRGGVYAVVGAEVQGTNLIAFRLVFPRYRLYMGRKLRPGWVCQNAIGDLIYPQGIDGPMFMGEWGRFHTFEPPQIESIITTGASTAHEIRLWLVFLGEDVSLLQQGMGGGALAGQPQPGVGNLGY